MNFKIDKYWNYWVLTNDFGFALDSSDTDLWNIDLLDTHTFRFVRYRYPHFFLSSRRLEDVFKTCLQGIFKTCLQGVFKTCLQDVLKTCLQDVFKKCLNQDVLQDFFSVTIFRLLRRLQDVLWDVFKKSSRRLQDVLEDEKLLRWRRVEEVFKTCLEDTFKTSWRPTNACCDDIKRVKQRQPSRGIIRKRCSENRQQIYRRTPAPPSHGCSPVNLLHTFRKPFLKNTTEGLLLVKPTLKVLII